MDSDEISYMALGGTFFGSAPEAFMDFQSIQDFSAFRKRALSYN